MSNNNNNNNNMTLRTKSSDKLAKTLAKESKQAILDLHVKKVILERTKNNGSIPQGFINLIVTSLKAQGFHNATRHTVYNHEKRMRRLQMIPNTKSDTKCNNIVTFPTPMMESAAATKNNNGDPPATTDATTRIISTTTDMMIDETPPSNPSPPSPPPPINKGGRPKKGSSTSSSTSMSAVPRTRPKQPRDKNTSDALDYAAKAILLKREEAKLTNSTVAKGVIDSIIEEANTKFGLIEQNASSSSSSSSVVKRGTVLSRVHRGNPYGWKGRESTSSPMADLEPILCDLCLQHLKSGQPLDAHAFLKLACNLVKGTPTEAKILQHKKDCKASLHGPLLGKRYYYNFLKRHSTILSTSMRVVASCKNDNHNPQTVEEGTTSTGISM